MIFNSLNRTTKIDRVVRPAANNWESTASALAHTGPITAGPARQRLIKQSNNSRGSAPTLRSIVVKRRPNRLCCNFQRRRPAICWEITAVHYAFDAIRQQPTWKRNAIYGSSQTRNIVHEVLRFCSTVTHWSHAIRSVEVQLYVRKYSETC